MASPRSLCSRTRAAAPGEAIHDHAMVASFVTTAGQFLMPGLAAPVGLAGAAGAHHLPLPAHAAVLVIDTRRLQVHWS